MEKRERESGGTRKEEKKGEEIKYKGRGIRGRKSKKEGEEMKY